MSYGSYGSGRYGSSGYGSSGYGSSGYGSYGGSNRRSYVSTPVTGTSSYVPSYSRRSTGGSSYGLKTSLSSSYLSPSSSPRSSISLGTTTSLLTRASKSYDSGGCKTLSADTHRTEQSPERTDPYKLQTSKSTDLIQSDDSSDSSSDSSLCEGISERARHRYGSSTSVPDTLSEVSSRSDTPSRYSSISCSRSSLNEDEVNDYKKLYEEMKKENERLKEALQKAEEELDKTKKQMQKLSQNNSTKNSVSETEKKEKRSLERKLSEMEEEIKLLEKLRADNERLRDENGALIRVISKLSK